MTKSTGQRPKYGSDLATKLAFYASAPNENGCILWAGALHSSHPKRGYGVLNFEGKRQPTHRLAYLLHKGLIPKGKQVCHSCDVPACINPDHLWVGTSQENMADMVRKGRQNKAKGEAHGNAKLTDKQVLAIFRDKRSGTIIAGEYRITRQMVNHIRRGDAWGHLTRGLEN